LKAASRTGTFVLLKPVSLEIARKHVGFDEDSKFKVLQVVVAGGEDFECLQDAHVKKLLDKCGLS